MDGTMDGTAQLLESDRRFLVHPLHHPEEHKAPLLVTEGRGVQMDMGPSVVLDTGRVEIALISRHVEPNDINCLLSLGIDPMQKRYVMLKSRIHWRAGLGSMAKAVVECAGIGVCTSDYSQLTFKNVRRPIYPLDLPNR